MKEQIPVRSRTTMLVAFLSRAALIAVSTALGSSALDMAVRRVMILL